MRLSVFKRCFSACFAVFLCATPAVRAAERPVAGSPTTAPCAAAPYHQFDFWLGDWSVYNGDTGQLVAKDHIETQFEGCVVQQTLQFVTDMYRVPGVAYRLAGASTSRFDGARWLQLWVDNQWGAIIMAGGAEKDGSVALNTVIPSRGRDVRLVWSREPGGVVRIMQYVAPTGSGKWRTYGNLIYRPDHRRRESHQLSSGASTPCLRKASIKGARCLS